MEQDALECFEKHQPKYYLVCSGQSKSILPSFCETSLEIEQEQKRLEFS